MKKGLIVCVIVMATLIFALNGTANALVLFDFEGTSGNPLAVGETDIKIENYMEEIYGSDITVTGAIASSYKSNGSTPGPPLGPDKFIKNRNRFSEPPWDQDMIEISFSALPVSDVQFEAGVFAASVHGNPDFVLEAEDAAGNPVGISDGGGANLGGVGSYAISANKWYWYTNWATDVKALSPLLIFDQPVTTLKFHDDDQFDIGIDNLSVTPVPEPSSMLLLGTGLLGLVGFKFRKKKRS